MRNAEINLGELQSNTGNSGALVIKNTTKMLIGLAVAGMVAMATTFGSVSADSPSVSTSFTPTGPNEMEPAYLNKLGRTTATVSIATGPNEMEPAYLNKLGRTTATVSIATGPNEMEPAYLNKLGRTTATVSIATGPNEMEPAYLNKLGVGSVNLGPDVVESARLSAHFSLGPDVAEWTNSII